MSFLERRRGLRTAFFAGLFVLGTLVVFLLIVGLSVDFGSFVEKELRAQGPKIEADLGRRIRFGRVRLKLLPAVRLELRDLALEAAPGQTGLLAQPLAQIGALRVRVALGPLLWSLGKRIEISALEIADLKVQLVRTADGHLSYEDILDKLATQPESPPPTPEQIERWGGIVLRQGTLSDAAIHFYDLATPTTLATPLKLDNIQLHAEDAQLFAPFKLTLDMAVLAAQPNFHLGFTAGPLPRDLRIVQPLALLRRVELALQPIEIEPILRFLPPSPGVRLGRARIEAKLNLETPANAGRLQLVANAAARGLVLEDDTGTRLRASRRGQPLDVHIETALTAAVLSGDVSLEKLELSINDMVMNAQADLRNLFTTPTVNKLSLGSRGILLEKLVAALPEGALPKGVVLRGPLILRGTATGSPSAAELEAALDLTPATLMLPMLAKPPGTPLSLELRGRVKGQNQGAAIERFGLTLGPMALLLRGEVGAGGDLALTLDSGQVDLDHLLRLLPSVENALEKGSRIDGDLRVIGSLKKKNDTVDVDTRVTMANARVDEGGLTLRGNAELSGQLHSTPANASVRADLDLSQAQLRVPGSVNKGQGVPMRMRTQLERQNQLVTVRLAELALPGGTLRVVGQVDLGRNRLDLKVPPVELDLSKLAEVLPALGKNKSGGLLDSRLKIGVSFDGDPNKLGTARARLDQFEMAVSGGTLKGSGALVGLDEPRKLTFNFSGDRLDFDRILGRESSGQSSETESRSKSDVPGFVRRLDMDGRVAVQSGRYKGATVRDLLLELTMTRGRLLIKTLRSQALSGTVDASGSAIDFGPSQPRFALRAKLDRIDIGEVLALRENEAGKKLTGKGSLDLSADGQGLAWSDIAPRITGQLGLGLTDARLQSASLGGQVINPLIAAVGKHLSQGSPQRDMAIRDLQARFRIDGGKLHTTTPIRMTTEEGALSLGGAIGLDNSLLLTGSLDLAPKAVSAATAGKVVPDAPIPVGLRLLGTLTAPQFELVDPGRTAAALLSAILRGRGKELLASPKGQPNLLGLPALGGQPGGAAPAVTPPPGAPPASQPSAQPPASAPVDEARRRLEEARKRGLGGLFGR